MASLLWGKVYFHDDYVGLLKQTSAQGSSFSYAPEYLQLADARAISHAMPLSEQTYHYQTELPPFFDNLVAEGWLAQAQTKLLGKRSLSRFELLLAFGFDCIGAVSVVDPTPEERTTALIDPDDLKEITLQQSHASLSGVQAKLAIHEQQGLFYPSEGEVLSTHIAKFESNTLPQLIENEYLSTLAIKALLPDDEVAHVKLGQVQNIPQPALIIERFDRKKNQRLHFEEFNQCFDQIAIHKYQGSYESLGEFIYQTPACMPIENYKLFNRLLASILIGNTDLHLKNIALFHTGDLYTLTPLYDNVAAALYQYKTLALSIANKRDFNIARLKPKHILMLAEKYRISDDMVYHSINKLQKQKELAFEILLACDETDHVLREQLIQMMRKRWNGLFALIGNL